MLAVLPYPYDRDTLGMIRIVLYADLACAQVQETQFLKPRRDAEQPAQASESEIHNEKEKCLGRGMAREVKSGFGV
jgi:hypothetical protein